MKTEEDQLEAIETRLEDNEWRSRTTLIIAVLISGIAIAKCVQLQNDIERLDYPRSYTMTKIKTQLTFLLKDRGEEYYNWSQPLTSAGLL